MIVSLNHFNVTNCKYLSKKKERKNEREREKERGRRRIMIKKKRISYRKIEKKKKDR